MKKAKKRVREGDVIYWLVVIYGAMAMTAGSLMTHFGGFWVRVFGSAFIGLVGGLLGLRVKRLVR